MFNLIYKWTDKIKSKVAELSKKLGEKGQGMVEYAMIIAAVAIIAVIVLWNGDNSLSASVKKAFGVAATNINNAATEGGNAGSNAGNSGGTGTDTGGGT